MLSVKDLPVSIGQRVLLPAFSANWPAGSLVAVLGANGRGKTTLLNHLAGIVPLPHSRLYLHNDDLATMPVMVRAARVTSIAQHDSADPETIVFDRIGHGLFSRRTRFDLSRADEERLILGAVTSVNLSELIMRPLRSLSGGQRKKAHIARCLVDDMAEMYVLDEPDASLDAESRSQIMRLFKTMAASGKLVVVSLHHRDLADLYADIVVDLGQTEPA